MEIFDNINSSSKVLCIECSPDTIELINTRTKLANIVFKPQNEEYSHIVIGKNILLEDEFFDNLTFYNELTIILEKKTHTLTEHYVYITMSSKYGFKDNVLDLRMV